jgi:hypothetical protein
MKINTIHFDSNESMTDLCALGIKYPTDKSPFAPAYNGSGHRHPYTPIYNFLFSAHRYAPIKLAEIGILNNMSMKCWREFFTNAKLFGFEYNLNLLENAKSHKLENTSYHFMDVTKEESIEEGLSLYGPYDIVIDDSTHTFGDQIRIILSAYKHIKPGGILIIEDIFLDYDEDAYSIEIEQVKQYFSSITFVTGLHKNKYSGDWNNDKMLVLHRNEKI